MDAALDVAIRAARAGGAVLRQMRAAFGPVRTKSTAVDLVTDADVAAGVAVCQVIADAIETARFVVEEPEVYGRAGVRQGDLHDDEVWVIDPLDGTTSFVHGYPCYSTSVAYLRDGVPLAGAVMNAATAELTAALAGSGAWLDGEPLRVSDIGCIEESLLITGFPYDRTEVFDRQIRVFEAIARRAHGIRRDGSAAVDCCHVAAGRADGFWEFALKPWDLAAGVVALREAGAIVTDTDGLPWSVGSAGIVTAGPALHELLLEAVLEAQR